MSQILLAGSSTVVPNGVNSLEGWVIGAGGGGAGSTNVDAGSGGAGAAGGVAYRKFIVSPGDTISYGLGAAGPGGVNNANGTNGGDTTLTIGGVTITGNGGVAGRYNNTGTNAGGVFSGGDGGANGGTGGGAGTGGSFDEGGAGGGAIGTVNGASGDTNAGKIGAQSADVAGLFAVLAELGYSTTSPGAAAAAGSPATANINHGGAATGFGCGGGGAGFYGGNGGAGLYGGGGGGAAGYTATNMVGGAGGQGVVVLSWSNTPLYISGAESGNITLEPTSNAGTSSITSSGPLSGTYSYQVNPVGAATGNVIFQAYSASTGKTAAMARPALFASFDFKPVTLPASNQEIIAGFFTGSAITTSVAKLVVKSTGVLVVLDSTGATIGTGTTALVAGTKYRLGFYANITTGLWAVTINGVVELTGTGASLGATNIGNFAIGKTQNSNSQTVNFLYDNVWLDSQNFAPPGYIIALDKPTANGATMSWILSDSGTGDYTHVNEIPADTTTYVEDPLDTSLPVIAEFAMQTFAQMGIPAGSIIPCVQVATFVADIGIAITNTFKQGLISNGVTSINSTNANTTTTFVNFGRLVQNDPNTSAAWTQAAIEAMQYYAQEGTTLVNTAISSALIMVAYIPPTRGGLPLLGVG